MGGSTGGHKLKLPRVTEYTLGDVDLPTLYLLPLALPQLKINVEPHTRRSDLPITAQVSNTLGFYS